MHTICPEKQLLKGKRGVSRRGFPGWAYFGFFYRRSVLNTGLDALPQGVFGGGIKNSRTDRAHLVVSQGVVNVSDELWNLSLLVQKGGRNVRPRRKEHNTERHAVFAHRLV